MGRLTSTSALALLLSVGVGATTAAATDVRFTMDWAWQGPQAYALMAQESGCFDEGGVNISFDRGFGSGRVPVDLAAGTYDMGVADINPTIKFRAENPDSDLIAVAVLFDGSPLVAVVSADSEIVEPSDFEGTTLAAPDFDAGRQLFPIFASANDIDQSTIEWISVSPELREPMLVQGEADGVTGFITSSTMNLERLGMSEDEQRVFRYKDYGVELYSTSILTSRAFAEANPEAVTTVVGCMIEGMKMAVEDPDAAIAGLAEFEPLTDVPIERRRWQISIDEMILTDNVVANGISAVDPERFNLGIMEVENAYGIPNALAMEDIYTDAYLPPAEDRMMPGM
ncbi:MAG: ABC transporter substrate-binding protein [Cohaesibacteraceae bacterium]